MKLLEAYLKGLGRGMVTMAQLHWRSTEDIMEDMAKEIDEIKEEDMKRCDTIKSDPQD